jgi:hypothetical protein
MISNGLICTMFIQFPPNCYFISLQRGVSNFPTIIYLHQLHMCVYIPHNKLLALSLHGGPLCLHYFVLFLGLLIAFRFRLKVPYIPTFLRIGVTSKIPQVRTMAYVSESIREIQFLKFHICFWIHRWSTFLRSIYITFDANRSWVLSRNF